MANETMGAVAGALLWMAAGPIVTRWVGGFAPSAGTSSDLARRLLTAYAAVWLVLGLLPFDVTIRPAELAQKFRAGRIHITPLYGGPRAASQVIVSTAILAAPIGALAALGWPRARQAAAWSAGALSGAAAIAGLELCQVFIFSRTASMDDAIGGAIGASAGAVLAWRLSRSGQDVSSTSAVRLWPVPVLLLWLLVIAIRHWSPFDFVVTGDMVRSRWPAMMQVPFRSYYWANPFGALGEAITKVFLGLPVGILLALAVPVQRSRFLRLARMALVILIGLAIFTAVEVGQMFLPSRYPDETDILLGVFGAWLGAAGAGLVLSTLAPKQVPSQPIGDKRYPSGRIQGPASRSGNAS
jgi:glycopeptide antibiotics resistance protein